MPALLLLVQSQAGCQTAGLVHVVSYSLRLGPSLPYRRSPRVWCWSVCLWVCFACFFPSIRHHIETTSCVCSPYVVPAACLIAAPSTHAGSKNAVDLLWETCCCWLPDPSCSWGHAVAASACQGLWQPQGSPLLGTGGQLLQQQCAPVQLLQHEHKQRRSRAMCGSGSFKQQHQ